MFLRGFFATDNFFRQASEQMSSSTQMRFCEHEKYSQSISTPDLGYLSMKQNKNLLCRTMPYVD